MSNTILKFMLIAAVIVSSQLLIISTVTAQNASVATAQDSMLIEAAKNYKSICASCHQDDMGWYKTRKWKYGKGLGDIATSITTGYPDMGMLSFRNVFTKKQIQGLATYVHNSLDREKEEKGIDLMDKNRLPTEKVFLRLDTIASGLDSPWGMAFLPNGDMLVSDKQGKMLRYHQKKLLGEISGLPEMVITGQGGLLDVRLHPDYKKNGWLYFTYSSSSVSKEVGWNTTLMRAKIKGNKLVEKQVLFKALPDTKVGHHLGGRIAFDGKGHVFVSAGERGFGDNAQDLTNDCGKIHRLNDDGTLPADNPFIDQAGAKKTIWTYGHRNPQGLIYNAETGILWESEHGPKGGDELNIIERGKNYGWPLVCFGINYDGTILTRDTIRAGMEQPITYWIPSIAPCGLAFVKGSKYKGWEGNILVGSLRFKYLVRCELDGNKVTHKEVLLPNIGRLRDIEMGPDGFVYISVESPGMIFKLVPVE